MCISSRGWEPPTYGLPAAAPEVHVTHPCPPIPGTRLQHKHCAPSANLSPTSLLFCLLLPGGAPQLLQVCLAPAPLQLLLHGVIAHGGMSRWIYVCACMPDQVISAPLCHIEMRCAALSSYSALQCSKSRLDYTLAYDFSILASTILLVSALILQIPAPKLRAVNCAKP